MQCIVRRLWLFLHGSLFRFKAFFRWFPVLILHWFNHEEPTLFAAMFAALCRVFIDFYSTLLESYQLFLPSRCWVPTCRLESGGKVLHVDPDGEDEGGQTSSLAVSTRWISTAKLLQSDLATLAQREGGE
ncbi:hypothetical protein BHM03_00053803 [Ensete ventricosum]|nr:hypothetical protein BHM03_00053803 [Ensete ventricosum]